METIKVLPFGARVRLSNIDMYGYCGRDLHPKEADEGFLGVVIENMVMKVTHNDMECMVNVPPGTKFISSAASYIPKGEQFHDIMYTVISPTGRKLQCMGHEIEFIGSPFSK